MTISRRKKEGSLLEHPLTGAVARRSKMFAKFSDFSPDKHVELLTREEMAYA
jgi:hypothetical protein